MLETSTKKNSKQDDTHATLNAIPPTQNIQEPKHTTKNVQIFIGLAITYKKIKDKVKRESSKEYPIKQWTDFTILSCFFYYPNEEKVKKTLGDMAAKIRADLGITSFTEQKVWTFIGAGNYGGTSAAFAIYNKDAGVVDSKHQYTKQLFFAVGEHEKGITYGLRYGDKYAQANGLKKTPDNILKDEDLNGDNYDHILTYFRKYLNEIIKDAKTRNNDDDAVSVLESKKQIILFGPPGTGKTFKTKFICVRLLKNG